MKKIIYLLLVFCLFSAFNANANINKIKKIEIEFKKISKEYSFYNHYIKSYSLNIDITDNDSESFVNDNDCNIKIKYKKNLNPILMKNFKKDIEFTFLHEISHCVLGRNIMFKDIQWIINISNKDKIKINNLIDLNEKHFLLEKDNQPVMLVYHEIFADTLASLYYLRKEYRKNDIIYLSGVRLNNYEKNPINEQHFSFSALQDVLKISKNELMKLSDESLYLLAINITQKRIIEYLNY